MEKVVIISQLLLLFFHQFTTIANLYPFNNVQHYTIKERLIECLVNGVMMAMPVIGFIEHIQWLMIAALVIYPVLLTGEYLSWWKHYFFGPTEEWKQTYERLFKHTIIILPPIKDHPIPNLEHCILHSLTLITTLLTYIYYFTN